MDAKELPKQRYVPLTCEFASIVEANSLAKGSEKKSDCCGAPVVNEAKKTSHTTCTGCGQSCSGK
jgi:hypothetical protein